MDTYRDGYLAAEGYGPLGLWNTADNLEREIVWLLQHGEEGATLDAVAGEVQGIRDILSGEYDSRKADR